MSEDYESVVRESFRRMSTEELIQRKARGSLVPSATKLIEAELATRGVTEAGYAKILEDARRGVTEAEYAKVLGDTRTDGVALSDLPDGLHTSDLASPGIRLVAHFIDHFIAICILVGCVMVSESLALLGFFGYVIYYLFSDALPGGKSIGKRLLGIRVVGVEGLFACTPMQSFKRNIIMVIPLIGFLDMFSIFGRRNQRWGDQWAGTLVTKGR